MKKTFTKVASVLILAVMALWTSDAFAGCNDPLACNYVSTDTDANDCNISLNVIVGGGSPAGQSWFEVVASDGLTVVISGQSPYDEVTCVPADCYVVRMYDVGGDGWSAGKQAVLINDVTGTNYGSVTLADGYEGSAAVTVGNPPCLVIGCSDPNYCNYDSTVNVDDGSCSTSCWGCVDTGACNYDSTATLPDLDKPDNGCNYTSCLGCTKSTACNYEPGAVIDDGSCCIFNCFDFTVSFQGTTSGSTSYKAQLEVYDAGSGQVVYTGAINNNATGSYSLGYTPGPAQSITLCLPDGCYEARLSDSTSSTGLKWQSTMSAPNGTFQSSGSSSADYENTDGVSSNAIEFVTAFTLGSGACAGCTDVAAANYDPFATIADNAQCCYGSVIYTERNGCCGSNSDVWIIYDEAGAIVAQGDTNSPRAEHCWADGCYRVWLNETGTSSWNRWSSALHILDSNNDLILRDQIGYENNATDGVNRLQIPRERILNIGSGSTCVPGCTDSTAANYDSTATWDDGSCIVCASNAYEVVLSGVELNSGDFWSQGNITFKIKDAAQATVFGPHIAYSNDSHFRTCLADGCYTIVVDGSNAATNVPFVGWEVYDISTGSLVQSGTTTTGNEFIVGAGCAQAQVLGCIDTAALNYNAQADTDDASCIYAPANDLCVDAVVIDCTTNDSVVGSSVGATFGVVSHGSYCNYQKVEMPGVWYVYNATASERVTFKTTGSNSQDDIFVYTGADCNSLTCIEAGKDRGYQSTQSGVAAGSDNAGLSIDVLAGNNYYLYVTLDNVYSTNGHTLEVSCESCSVPVNGECSNAITLTDGVVEAASLCCAPLQDLGANLNTNFFEPGSSYGNTYGVWYSINTGDADAWVLTVNNYQSHGQIAYEMGVMYKVGCNGAMNNAKRKVEPAGFVKRTDWDHNSDLRFLVHSPQFELCGNYDIQVDLIYYGCMDAEASNYDSTATEDDGTCTYAGAPVNDLCANAIVLNCGDNGIYSFGAPTVTGQFTGVASCDAAPGAGTWFTTTGGAADSLMTISTCGSTINSHMNIYKSDSDCSGNMTCVSPSSAFYGSCDDDETIDVVIEAGVTYYIYITKQGGPSGTHTLSATCAVPVIGCTDSVACNYDSTASIEDGSCTYPGCNDSSANNYVPSAGCLAPGSCCYTDWVTITASTTSPYIGSTTNYWGIRFYDGAGNLFWTVESNLDTRDLDNSDPNYNVKYTFQDSMCFPTDCYTYKIYAPNMSYYGPHNTFIIDGLNGSSFTEAGSDPASISKWYNYNFYGSAPDKIEEATQAGFNSSPFYTSAGNALCGCGDVAACNYDSGVNDNGDCDYVSCVGCTNAGACNYDSSATVDSGDCCFDNCANLSIEATYSNFWNEGVSWEIRQVSNDSLVYSGNNSGVQALEFADFLCLPGDVCYKLDILGTQSWMANEFKVTLNGASINGGLGGVSKDFGEAVETWYFTTGSGNCTQGCAYPDACNYDSTAGRPEYTTEYCDFAGCSGCTYADADNYDSTAALDNGTCVWTNTCPTDLNGDLVTGVDDLLALLSAFGNACP